MFQPYYRRIVVRWEKLRVLYNLLLLVATLGAVYSTPTRSGVYTGLGFMTYVVIRGLEANVLFCAGPVADLALGWVGFNTKTGTVLMFAMGTILSVLLAFGSVWLYVLQLQD